MKRGTRPRSQVKSSTPPPRPTTTTLRFQKIMTHFDMVTKPEDLLDEVLRDTQGEDWFRDGVINVLAYFRHDVQQWPMIEIRAKVAGAWPPDLRSAVDHRLAQDALVDYEYALSPAIGYGDPTMVHMTDVEAQPIMWLWWPYIPLGMITLVDGDPGLGKSLLMTNLAACLSQGYALPDQQGRPTIATHGYERTLLLSAEDSLSHIIRPRLESAGADMRHIHALTGWTGAEGEEKLFTFQHMPILEGALETFRPSLVVIDPIQAYLGGIDMHRANETRPLMTALGKAAEAYQCAIVCIRHLAKPGQGGGKAIHRGLGSIDFIGAARSALFIESHPLDSTRAMMAQTKSNIGPFGRTQMFTKQHGQFAWAGVTRLSAEMIAGVGRGPDPIGAIKAFLWLESQLEGSIPQPATTLFTQAEEADISQKVLRKAKSMLAVRSQQHQDGWYWQLPTIEISLTKPPTQYGIQGIQGTTGDTGDTGVNDGKVDVPFSSLPPTYMGLQGIKGLQGIQGIQGNKIDNKDVNEADTRKRPVTPHTPSKPSGYARARVANNAPESNGMEEKCVRCGHFVVKDAEGWICPSCTTRKEEV